MDSNKTICAHYKRKGRSVKANKAFQKLNYIDEVHDMRGDTETHLYTSAQSTEVQDRSAEYVEYLQNKQPRPAVPENVYPDGTPNVPPREFTTPWIHRAGSQENPIDLTYSFGMCPKEGCERELSVRGGIGADKLCNQCYVTNICKAFLAK